MTRFTPKLSEKNIRIVNPLWDSIAKKYIVGWLLKSSSMITLPSAIGYVEDIIKNNRLEWWVEEIEGTNTFFVYKYMKMVDENFT